MVLQISNSGAAFFAGERRPELFHHKWYRHWPAAHFVELSLFTVSTPSYPPLWFVVWFCVLCPRFVPYLLAMVTIIPAATIEPMIIPVNWPGDSPMPLSPVDPAGVSTWMDSVGSGGVDLISVLMVGARVAMTPVVTVSTALESMVDDRSTTGPEGMVPAVSKTLDETDSHDRIKNGFRMHFGNRWWNWI